jgi:hypothetical protein
LKTLLGDHPQILTSTKELVHSFETALKPKLRVMTNGQWRDRVFICTADIEGFYTNVPIKLCREKLGDLVKQKYGKTREGKVKADYVMSLFDVQQNNLIMRAQIEGNWHLVLQKDGLAMGMPAAPDIANLFAAWYEKRFSPEFYRHCLVFKRYIDDIFCLVTADSRDHCVEILKNYYIPGLKLNWDVSETKSVFLDLEIWRNPYSHTHVLKYRPYRKPGNNFERLPWCTGHSLQLLRAAFKSEIHRFAVASYCTAVYKQELDWLKDLYISRGYPPATVMAWIKKFKDSAYKTRLDWTFTSEEEGDLAVWPLKSTMNPVWTKLSLHDVTESMRKAAQPFMLAEANADEDPDGELSFSHRFNYWFKRMVASQKRPFNMGDKENKHNRGLLGIQTVHSKFSVAGRSALQRHEDEIAAGIRRADRQFDREWNMRVPGNRTYGF